MISFELLKRISVQSESRIVLIVVDGLGGLPDPKTGKSELEAARTPKLDALASKSVCGMMYPVAPGITPGSGPGHLAIFGYDPLTFDLGRGVLEAAGIDFDLREGDLAARGNFATLDDQGDIIDRRAGRISTERNSELCRILDGQVFEGTEVIIRPLREHRFLAVFRGQNLSAAVSDTDPLATGVPAKEASALDREAEATARVVNRFVRKAKQILASHQPANMVLLRGFSKRPKLPTLHEVYKLRTASVAIYPMYRGLARLLGMEALDSGTEVEDQFQTVAYEFGRFDFIFLHVKHADSYGEDGDFQGKVEVLEKVDGLLGTITDLNPDVLIVTGDHSTPAVLNGHSWHPVPFALASKWCRPDGVSEFSESACLYGGLGRFPALDVMPLAMANALKLLKFGA